MNRRTAALLFVAFLACSLAATAHTVVQQGSRPMQSAATAARASAPLQPASSAPAAAATAGWVGLSLNLVPAGEAAKPGSAAESKADAESRLADAQARREQAATRHALQVRLIERAGLAAELLAAGAVLALLMAIVQAWRHGLRFASYWGGFGGTGTGWQLTPAAVSLLAALLLAGSALLLFMGVVHGAAPTSAPPPATGQAAAPKA